jgi:DNA-binding NarL/FixJ family response regulator
MKRQTIIIADDHPLLLKGLSDFLLERGYNVIGKAENGEKAYELIQQLNPDIAILDIQMPILSGLEIAKKCLHEEFKTKVVLITFHKEKELFYQSKDLNIFGYLLKDFALEEIENCIKTVTEGTPYFSAKILELLNLDRSDPNGLDTLTPSEKKILKLIASDKTNKEIAALLFISHRTVEKHRSNIINKLHLEQKTNSLLIWAKEHQELLH